MMSLLRPSRRSAIFSSSISWRSCVQDAAAKATDLFAGTNDRAVRERRIIRREDDLPVHLQKAGLFIAVDKIVVDGVEQVAVPQRLALLGSTSSSSPSPTQSTTKTGLSFRHGYLRRSRLAPLLACALPSRKGSTPRRGSAASAPWRPPAASRRRRCWRCGCSSHRGRISDKKSATARSSRNSGSVIFGMFSGNVTANAAIKLPRRQTAAAVKAPDRAGTSAAASGR